MFARLLTTGCVLFLTVAISCYGQSAQSVLSFDPGFVYTSRLSYLSAQTLDITNGPTSVALAGYKIQDGDGSSSDADAAATTITDITFAITTNGIPGASSIRRLALYDGSGIEIQELGYAGNPTVTFSAISLSAADDGASTFTVRASFTYTATDMDLIQLRIHALTQGAGSLFNPTNGITGSDLITTTGALTPNDKNKIDVTATKLDFTTQPSPSGGINMPFAGGVVEARDPFNNTDLEFNIAATITSAQALVSAAPSFVNGILDLNSINYVSPGDGTMVVAAGSLSSVTSSVYQGYANVSIQCSHVSVFHTTAELVTSGVATQSELTAGAVNKVIFAVHFIAPYTEVFAKPSLRSFTLDFSTNYPGILQNFRILMGGLFFSAAFPDIERVPSIGAVTTQTGNKLIIFFPTPINLDDPNLTFYLLADVNLAVNESTPPITVSLVDMGYGTATDNNIRVTDGSSYSALAGPTFSFTAIGAPRLIASTPSLGKTNVDIRQSTIDLQFSEPVWTLDHKLILTEQLTSTQVVLSCLAGSAFDPATLTNTLKFPIPPFALLPDRLYNISVASGDVSAGTGIINEDGNAFAGLPPGTLYFRTQNTSLPKLLGVATGANADPFISNISLNSAVINATFDEPGIAHYMITTSPSLFGPASDMILGYAPWGGGTVLARGSFDITQTNTVSSFGIAFPSTPFAPGTIYEVWMCASTDPLSPGALFPFGSNASNFLEGTPGPTLTFLTPVANPTQTQINAPSFELCADSYQPLNQPIMISEGLSGEFSGAGGQVFNIHLPSGFEFDTSLTGGVPTYGALRLKGSDFIGTGNMSFVTKDLLQVQFQNFGSVSQDIISITGLRVKGNSGSSGPMVRIGGNALPQIPDGVALGSFTTRNTLPVSFTDSYSMTLSSPPVAPTIPANVVPGVISLVPTTTNGGSLFNIGDFGPSLFSGPGVAFNTFNIATAPPDTPLPIKLTHTDGNGCVSEATIQYVVSTTPLTIAIPDNLCKTNISYGPSTPVVHTITVDNIPGYYQETLSVSIPTATPQVISGPAWQAVVQNLLIQGTMHFASGISFFDYSFDENVIFNAANFNSAIADPYTNFMRTTPLGKTYSDGGSLGILEFTGFYRQVASLINSITKKKQVEFLLAPIPVVEVTSSSIDLYDPLNPSGTPIFCEQSAPVTILGYPVPVPGISAGTFTLTDALSGSPIGNSLPGFSDNGNGTATFEPASLKNTFRDVRITYTFQKYNSPCGTSASQVIRVVPNPTASFTMTSEIGPNTPLSTARCAGSNIVFDPRINASPNASFAGFHWDFGDGNSESSNVNAPISHIFSTSAVYSVKLIAEDSWHCLSPPLTSVVSIGKIPTPTFDFIGATTADNFILSNNTINDFLDPITRFDWDYGDGATSASFSSGPGTHVYANPGTYTASLKATTTKGCVNITSKPVIVMAASAPSTPSGGSGSGGATGGGTVTAVEPIRNVSGIIGNNYPNPFRDFMMMPLSLPASPNNYSITLTLHDLAGRQLGMLLDTSLEPGDHTIRLERTLVPGLSPGMYICKVQVACGTSSSVVVRKIMLE